MSDFGGGAMRAEVRRRQLRDEAYRNASSRRLSKHEGHFPQNDPRYQLLKDQTPGSDVREAINYRDYICVCKKPHNQWFVSSTPTRGDIPSCLSGAYVNREVIINAIQSYLEKGDKDGNETASR